MTETQTHNGERHVPLDVAERIIERVRQQPPSTILIASDSLSTASELQRDLVAVNPTISIDTRIIESNNDTTASRYDLAIVLIVDSSQNMAPKQRRLLSQFRDTGAARVLATVNREAVAAGWWQIADFIALGYRRSANSRSLTSGWALYYYDIHDYKPTPDWLNKRYWANPERWDQERW